MPELPEVEALRRGLINNISGQRIKKIQILYPKIVSGKGTKREISNIKTKRFVEGLSGQTIDRIDRRAKNLIFHMKDGSVMLVHLKMTGQLVYISSKTEKVETFGGHPIELSQTDLPNKHTAIVFELEEGYLYYNDVRKFGYVVYYHSTNFYQQDNQYKTLGIEPLVVSQDSLEIVKLNPEFQLGDFHRNLASKRSAIKKVFLDQSVVVGLGNIYCDEVCFEAGVLPTRVCDSLTSKEVSKLYEAISRILPLAVELGGSSVANYLLADGSRGNYAREHKVYQKGGQNCYKCDKRLEKIKLAGRTTVYCSQCQK